jgi:putative addiction module component (TIGR02574 family)
MNKKCWVDFFYLYKNYFMSYDIKELIALPEQDKKEIITELMESIAQHPENNIPLWKAELYKERLAYYKQNPNEGVEWSVLRKKYLSSL